jgi:hypothetical protein
VSSMGLFVGAVAGASSRLRTGDKAVNMLLLPLAR